MAGQVEFNARLERAAMHCRCNVLDDIFLVVSQDGLRQNEKRPRSTVSTWQYFVYFQGRGGTMIATIVGRCVFQTVLCVLWYYTSCCRRV